MVRLRKLRYLYILGCLNNLGYKKHRQQIISLDNEMIKIKCFARSSAALMLFSEHLKKEIENRILGNRGDDDDEIFKILKLLLHTEKKNWY